MARPIGLVRAVVIIVSSAYAVLIFVLGFDLLPWWRVLVSMFPILAAGFVMAWDLWIWRWPGIIRLFRRPDLRGLWRVTLSPHEDSAIPEGGNWGPVVAYLEVRQTFWSIHLKLYTLQSSSRSTAFSWINTPENEVDCLSYIYDGMPKISETSFITRNIGVGTLAPTSLKPTQIEGRYFTDRPTKGDLVMEFVDRTSGYPSFNAADRYADSIRASQGAVQESTSSH